MSVPVENFLLCQSNLGMAQGAYIGARSGLMTGIAADADVYATRNIAAQAMLVSAVRSVFLTTTAATAIGSFAVQYHKVVGFTGVHSGGTPTAVQAHYKRSPAFQARLTTEASQRIPLTEISTVIAGTAAITKGTGAYTDPTATEPFDMAAGACSNAATATTFSVAMDHIWTPEDGIPIPIESDEGIVGKLPVAMPTALVGVLFVFVNFYRQV